MHLTHFRGSRHTLVSVRGCHSKGPPTGLTQQEPPSRSGGQKSGPGARRESHAPSKGEGACLLLASSGHTAAFSQTWHLGAAQPQGTRCQGQRQCSGSPRATGVPAAPVLPRLPGVQGLCSRPLPLGPQHHPPSQGHRETKNPFFRSSTGFRRKP